MYDQIVGSCPHCGAPIYSPGVWHGVCPPPSIKTCMCIPSVQQYEIKTSTGENFNEWLGTKCANILDEEKFKNYIKKLLDVDPEEYRKWMANEDWVRELDKEDEEKQREKDEAFHNRTNKKSLLNLKEL
ncbi:hypothetical protein M0R19_05225 [Candidatus Pacearchaeota archaeon]|jgi:hypothetical protein|nr:hypothetical protein [Candidatus Pacearchaeota archaeon]